MYAQGHEEVEEHYVERVVHHVAEAEAGRLARRDVGAEGEIRGHEEVADKAHDVADGVVYRQPEAALQEEPIETVTVDPVPGLSEGMLIPGATGVGSSVGAVGANETLPTLGGTTSRVSAEASAASRAKYIEGLDAFNQDDYERARQAWIVAKQLDPGNSDADLGLRKVEELLR